MGNKPICFTEKGKYISGVAEIGATARRGHGFHSLGLADITASHHTVSFGR